MSERDAIYRNLTEPQPLDVEAELQRMMLTAGVLQSVFLDGKTGRELTNREVWDILWRRIPFVRALAELGREHRLELRARWKQALQEPMPFGGEPLGLPEGEEP
jgi:hypothetical protein